MGSFLFVSSWGNQRESGGPSLPRIAQHAGIVPSAHAFSEGLRIRAMNVHDGYFGLVFTPSALETRSYEN
jgi:hypothetical protein